MRFKPKLQLKEVVKMEDTKKPVLGYVKESDLRILGELRKNSRQTLAEISRATNVSISTIYDRIRFHEDKLIKKHTSILNFEMLGFGLRANVLLSTKNKDELKEYIARHPNINSAFEINNEYDFLIDCIFANMSECRDFLDALDQLGIDKKQVHNIINDIKVESFMTADYENAEK